MKTTDIIQRIKEHRNMWKGENATLMQRILFFHSHIKMYFFIKKLRKDKRYAALKELPFFLWHRILIKYAIRWSIITALFYGLLGILDASWEVRVNLPLPQFLMVVYLIRYCFDRNAPMNEYRSILIYNIKTLENMPKYLK